MGRGKGGGVGRWRVEGVEREDGWGEGGGEGTLIIGGGGVEGRERRRQNRDGEVGGVARGRYVTEGLGFRKGGQE